MRGTIAIQLTDLFKAMQDDKVNNRNKIIPGGYRVDTFIVTIKYIPFSGTVCRGVLQSSLQVA